MLGGIRLYESPHDEAEKPFWISYADLMTSLMVLFLVVMLASLVTVSRTVADLQSTKSHAEVLAEKYRQVKRAEAKREHRDAVRTSQIDRFWDRLAHATRGLGARINRNTRLINFGSRARFGSGSDVLAPKDQLLLRRFTPNLLALARSKLGLQVLDRVVVEGYADRRGSYLFNLNLSSNRSQRVLCTLLKPGGAAPLLARQKKEVRDLFLVGGFSFNDSRRSLAASRRVEIRVDFVPLGTRRTVPPSQTTAFGDCALSG
jgi:outer membrane protein OmpA-like peptidoglycan-associated protein